MAGRAILTLQTRAPELAGASVRFVLGRETGEVTLAAGDTAGAWSGRHALTSFSAVEGCLPEFELVPVAR